MYFFCLIILKFFIYVLSILVYICILQISAVVNIKFIDKYTHIGVHSKTKVF